jgi:hypothetical protein
MLLYGYEQPHAIMKTSFKAEAAFKSGPSETGQTVNGLDGASLRNRSAGSPPFAGCSWRVPSARNIVLRNDDSVLMKSQLG